MPGKLRDACLRALEDLLRNLGAGLGMRLRRAYYRKRLRTCGKNLRVDCGVYLTNPQHISLGDDVLLDKGVIITAGPAGGGGRCTRTIENPHCTSAPGHVRIGHGAHLGIGTILQGHGGISIGDYFTSSSRCSIYSLSNDPYRCRNGTIGGSGTEVYYIASPVCIGRNVWLGLNTIVIGHTIHDDTFVRPNSVVTADVGPNEVVQGDPASVVRARFERGQPN